MTFCTLQVLNILFISFLYNCNIHRLYTENSKYQDKQIRKENKEVKTRFFWGDLASLGDWKSRRSE